MSHSSPPVRMTCAFEVPAERLFDAWLDPALARLWLFAAEGGEIVSAEIDPQVGGTFTITERRGGDEVVHRGAFLHVERPLRLAFSLDLPGPTADRTVVSVAFMPVGGLTILSLTHEDVPAGAIGWDDARWPRMLDRLAVTLERFASGVPEPTMP